MPTPTRPKVDPLPVVQAESDSGIESEAAAWVQEAYYELGGLLHPLVVNPNCVTCHHPQRIDIEKWILYEGFGWSRAVQRCRTTEVVMPSGRIAELTYDNVREHWRRHAPEKMVARRASQIQAYRDSHGGAVLDLEDAAVNWATVLGASRMMTRLGIDALLEGKMEFPSFREFASFLPAAAAMEAAITEDAGGTELLAMRGLQRFVEIVRQNAPPEVWDAIGADVVNDEVLKAIDAHYTGAETPQSKEVVDRELAALASGSDPE